MAAKIKGGVVYAVDTWSNHGMGSEIEHDTFAEFVKNTADVHENIRIVRGWSTEVESQIPSDLDMVFVDGDHDFEPVLKDLMLYVPKIKKGGLLLMHDFNMVGVNQAANEAQKHFNLRDHGYQVQELHSYVVF
jgi:predicted O-methyltransferase YrrM